MARLIKVVRLEERQHIGDGQAVFEHRAEHRLLGLRAVRGERLCVFLIEVLQVIVGDPVCDAVGGGHDCWSPRCRIPRSFAARSSPGGDVFSAEFGPTDAGWLALWAMPGGASCSFF